MFWDDIKLVTEQVEKYGLRQPMMDIGGMKGGGCIADYDLTMKTGDQQARYLQLNQNAFDHIDPTYTITNPGAGDPCIEEMPKYYKGALGTALCLNVIEHVLNPFEIFAALYQCMSNNSLLIISTVFSFPYHPSPLDYWRYTPDCLRYLSEGAGFQVLECDWRLMIPADKGIRSMPSNELQEIRGVYVTLTKGQFTKLPSRKYALPARRSNNEMANRIIQQENRTCPSIVLEF